MSPALRERGGLSYDQTWNWPYWSGSRPSSTVRPFHVSINGQRFAVNLEKYRRTTMQIRRLATDDSVEPGEQSLNATGLWPRAQDNFFLGAGQHFLDNRFAFQNVYVSSGEFPSVRTRFWRSKGINPWVEGAVSLHFLQGQKRTSTNTNLFLCATDTALYVSDGDELYWSTDPGAVSPTWHTAGVAAASSGATITSITTSGSQVWAACGTAGVFVTANESSSAAQAAETGMTIYGATFIGYANGRLLGSTGRDMVEIKSDGSTAVIWTHPDPSFIWTTVCSTPSAILIGGFAGSMSYVGSVMPDGATEGASLSPPTTATTLPTGEQINDIVYSAGSLLLASNLGVRAGTRPDSTGVFDINPVVTDPGPVLSLASWLQYAYFTWTAYSTLDEVNPAAILSSGLGRTDLSQFTQKGTPAYATDVMATDGLSDAAISVAVLNGVPYFSITGSGVWGPTTDRVATGYFESGWIRYGTTEPKILARSLVQHDVLLPGQSVGITAVDEYGASHTQGLSQIPGTTSAPEPFNTDLLVGERFMMVVSLYRGTDETQGPTLRYWQADAMVAPRRQDEILCPVLLYDEVTTVQLDSQPVTQDTLALFLYLKNLEELGEPVTYQEGDGVTLQAFIDQVQMAPSDMNRDRSWFQGECTVKLMTLPTGPV